MDEGTVEAREFLKRALRVTGLTPHALAKRAGVAASTITRPLNDPDFKFVPKQATLVKIAKAAGLAPPQLPEPNLQVEFISRLVPLVGEVRAGVWTEIPDEPVVEEQIAVHLPEYDRATLFAVRVVGRSMDLRYLDGTVVIACPPSESGVRLGDTVIVRRRQGRLAETTLKEVHQEQDGEIVLYPRSSDPSFQPIRLKREADSDDGPEIIGVVIYSINPSRSGRGPLVQL
jgi:SOS-response transcriptional repressor LexA